MPAEPVQQAEDERERSRLFRQVVPLTGHGDEAQTDWFSRPDEGMLVHVEWDREVAMLTWMITRYPRLIDGQADG